MTGWTDTPEAALSLMTPAAEANFSPEEMQQLQTRLFLLLDRQMRLKTQGDHTSLPAEEAAELYESVCYSLQAHLELHHLDARQLLSGDPAALLRAAQETLNHIVADTRQLYNLALEHVLPLGHRALIDTLAGIGEFFKVYDVRLYAHQLPAHIDYQLCHPVAETLTGVFYLRDYLLRLLTENELLLHFPEQAILALMQRLSPDFRELLINLYEPVAANVVGLSLLCLPPTQLALTAHEADRISDLLLSLPPREARACLRDAALRAAQQLALPSGDAVAYLAQTAQDLFPRLSVGQDSARGVFLAVADAAP